MHDNGNNELGTTTLKKSHCHNHNHGNAYLASTATQRFPMTCVWISSYAASHPVECMLVKSVSRGLLDGALFESIRAMASWFTYLVSNSSTTPPNRTFLLNLFSCPIPNVIKQNKCDKHNLKINRNIQWGLALVVFARILTLQHEI